MVLPDFPADLGLGMFAAPRTYRALVRFSNGANRRQSDRAPDVRGIAVKVLGVDGKKVIPGMEDATTQDFLAIRSSALAIRDTEEFMTLVRLRGVPGAAPVPARVPPWPGPRAQDHPLRAGRAQGAAAAARRDRVLQRAADRVRPVRGPVLLRAAGVGAGGQDHHPDAARRRARRAPPHHTGELRPAGAVLRRSAEDADRGRVGRVGQPVGDHRPAHACPFRTSRRRVAWRSRSSWSSSPSIRGTPVPICDRSATSCGRATWRTGPAPAHAPRLPEPTELPSFG